MNDKNDSVIFMINISSRDMTSDEMMLQSTWRGRGGVTNGKGDVLSMD